MAAVDPREVVLWLAQPDRLARYAAGLLSGPETDVLQRSVALAIELGTWSISDVPLIDEVAARIGPVRDAPPEDRGFYQIEHLDALLEELGGGLGGSDREQPSHEVTPKDTRDRLLVGRIRRPDEYAHVLVDEAQDLSPMQWRMLGRRAGHASWTVVGDPAQSSWAATAESDAARAEAYGGQPRQVFHMATNYRNAREIFDYAASVIRAEVPDADIPEAVRETGQPPRELPLGSDPKTAVRAAVAQLLDEVDGPVAVIAPAAYAAGLAELETAEQSRGRVRVIAPLASKGLEWDATVVVGPRAIVAESPGAVRTLYVALTRAAHRMTVLTD